MTSKYVIFKLRSDGSFLWIEAVEDILAAKQRLEILAVNEPGRNLGKKRLVELYVSTLFV
jgi:hypothetical protein